MSMDGTSNSCSRAPLSLHPFSPRGLSPFWPQLGTGTFTKGPFAPPKNFGYRSEYHIGSPRVSKLRASLMRVGIGSAPYGLGGSVLNSIGYVFRRVQQQNSYKYEDSFALEAEILEFMNQSDRPELFPSQSELMKAGRSDLVEKILARGGWMVAGWDVEPCIENQAQNFENIAIANSNIEHFTKVSSELTDNFKNRQLAKMEKCSAGVFSTTLQLYPGEYEIKFVVDGTWRVDANRPKTFASGHENNVLAVL
ncbi:hypothetical protein KP509_23G010100 [Ceratopteris richardii]|uniref:AMP-activated protein kinase glycogen-binding domain-containing protein n=1 Tax=Ceratopteris richardii TaxID=49495 RepID=A0A8T2RYX3_CERRI|nr:hypothetical protein KP509_23G010100 [Ceratopteris richardii]